MKEHETLTRTPQAASLEAYHAQFDALTANAEALTASLDASQFNWKPDPSRWSIGQCVEHLNLSGETMALPALDALLNETRRRGAADLGEPMREPRLGAYFLRSNEPPVTRRFKTFRRFTPASTLDRDVVLGRFVALNAALRARLDQAEGLDLGAARKRIPLLIPLTLGQWFGFTAAHGQRHLWQARQVLGHPAFPLDV